MGLDVSHDAWSGAYSAFHRWRKSLAKAAGGRFEDDPTQPGWATVFYDDTAFDTLEQEAGFLEIMGHSDCDGEISPEMCKHVADALGKLLPRISEVEAGGHMPNVRLKTLKFIEGCRVAHRVGESLKFG